MKVTIQEKDFRGYPFSEAYIEWIKESAKAVKSITKTEIIVESEIEEDCFQALIFLGYAWGQQDNGR